MTYTNMSIGHIYLALRYDLFMLDLYHLCYYETL